MAVGTIITMNNMNATFRLWQLISPALPIGAYAYSQGFEYAIEAGWVKDEAEVYDWIKGQLQHNLAYLDVPVLKRLYSAWQADDQQAITYWTQYILASREAAELKTEDQHLGRALATLLSQLGVNQSEPYIQQQSAAFVTTLSLAAVHWHISIDDLAHAYLWMWCENQIAVAIKLVPLGQTSGQRLLLNVSDAIPSAVQLGLALADEKIGMAAPGLGIASTLHETQYSRLFRS